MTVWIPWIFAVGLAASVLGLYAFVSATRYGDRSLIGIGVFGLFTLLFGIAVIQWLFWSAFVRPRVVPYFARQLEPYGGLTSVSFAKGRAVYLELEQLEESAAMLGITPLTAFGFADDFYGQDVRWHPAAEGSRTVEALLRDLTQRPHPSAALAGELEALASVLCVAADRDVPFALVLRLYSRDSVQAVATLEERHGAFW
jgi:hypothetical protein